MPHFADVPARAACEFADATFASARDVHVRYVRFADQLLRLELAGPAITFADPFMPASDLGEPDLTLQVWDSSCAAAWPQPLLDAPRCLETVAFADATIAGRGEGSELSAGHARHQVFWEPFWTFGFDLASKRAWFHVPRVADAPPWGFEHPFLKLLHPWLRTRGRLILHAGAIGRERCALIVGPGGSGKSTLSIAGQRHGLGYLGDDYVAVNVAAQRAFGLYRVAKLVPEHLRTMFAELEAQRLPALDPSLPKARLAIDVTHPDGMPIAAIVVPRVGAHHDFAPTSAADALRALAPSTLFQLPGYPADLAAMAALVRMVPAYRLTSGPDLAASLRSIEALT